MVSIGSYEAKTHLPSLLERVAKGEEFTITKHGVPVARLVPCEPTPKLDPDQVVQEFLQFREKHTLDRLSIREMIDEGRRF